jgi:hypothetical protein
MVAAASDALPGPAAGELVSDVSEVGESADREKKPVFSARALPRVATNDGDEAADIAVVVMDDRAAQMLERVGLLPDGGPVLSQPREEAACGAALEFVELHRCLLLS